MLIDDDLVGPHAIINRAALDDRVGAVRTVQALRSHVANSEHALLDATPRHFQAML